MNDIQFSVSHQKLTPAGRPFLVGNSRDYLTATFQFSEDWTGLAKVVFFSKSKDETYAFLLVDDAISADQHLNLSSGDWDVWMYGFAGNVEDISQLPTDVMRISTNKTHISVGINGAPVGNVLEDEPASLGDQILAAAQNAVNTADSVREDADNGRFNGKDGRDGRDGRDGVDGETGPVGPRGSSGVYIGDTEPTDANVWLKPGGEASIPATQDFVNKKMVVQSDDYYPYWNSVVIDNQYAIANVNVQFPTKVAAKTEAGVSYSGVINARLPYPLVDPTLTGTSDYGGHFIANVNSSPAASTATKYDTANTKLRIYSLRGEDVGADMNDTLRLTVCGKVAVPPTAPTLAPDTVMASQMQAIAQSYVNAANAGRVFVYGPNWLYTSSNILNAYSTRVKDSSGNYIFGGRMECDTFVQMILHGIPYELSQYVDTASPTFNYDDLATLDNPNNYAWSAYWLSNIKNNPSIRNNGDVRWAAELAWLAWTLDDKACIFTDHNQAHAGDIAFYKADGTQLFDNISHVAFVGEENGEKYIYEVTTEKSSHPNAVYKTKMSEKTRFPAYYVRVNLAGPEVSE